jgi:glycosyltransferase involved in cell wall biosynthesis
MRLYWYWPFARAEDMAFARAIPRPGDRMTVHTIDEAGRPAGTTGELTVVADLAPVERVPEHSLRWGWSRSSTYLQRLRKRRQQIVHGGHDVCHVYYHNYLTDGLDLHRLWRRRRVISHVHDLVPHHRRVPRPVERRLLASLYGGAPFITVHDVAIAEGLVSDFGVDEARVAVLPLPVPDPGVGARRSRPDRDVVLFFGALRHNKGLAVLLDAVRQLDPSTDLSIVVAGRGFADEERRVQEYAAHDHRVKPEIGLVSEQRKAELFEQASVVVLPYTSFDSQSAVLNDAYGYRVPVVVSDVGALGRSVAAEGTGWLVPPGDAEALAAAITDALTDDERYERSSRAADEVARARRPAKVGAEFRALYDRLLGDASAVFDR